MLGEAGILAGRDGVRQTAHVRSSEQFKREAAGLVVEEGYSPNQAAGRRVRGSHGLGRRYVAEAQQQVAYASEADELAQLR